MSPSLGGGGMGLGAIRFLTRGRLVCGLLVALVAGAASSRSAMTGPAAAAPGTSVGFTDAQSPSTVLPARRDPRFAKRLEQERVRAQLEVLARAADRKDPLAFADLTLPRLGDLDQETRAQLAECLADWDVGSRVAAWAFLQVGTLYRLGPLGEEAPPDTDPLIQFQTTDCAVLNLVSVALAHMEDEGGERQAMAVANYRGGVVSYATRFHFTTDRLDSSRYYRDITERVGGRACRHRLVVLNRKANGGRWIPIDWSRPREVFYLPRALGSRFAHWHDRGRLPAATGVAFVQVSRMADGLDVVHESMLWKGRTLLHASSLTGRVVTIPWTEFLSGPGRRYDGFVLFEYR